MENLTRDTSGQWTRVVTGLGAGTYTTNVPDAQRQQFSFSGFGSSGKPPYRYPVAGTYSKTTYSRPKGSKNEKMSNQYGTPTSEAKSSGVHSYWTMLGSGSGLDAIAFDPSIKFAAESNFYDNLRSSESNLALTLGESKESWKMMRAFRSLSEIIHLARRARRLVVKNPSLLISNVWLSMKYGWLPLYSDVYGLLNWQYSHIEDGIPVIGRAQRTSRTRVNSYFAGLHPSSRGTVLGETKYKCEIKCWVGVQNSDLYNLTRVTSLNPVSIAWELVPFSFVVDWFVDVGGYLQNLEASLGTGLVFKYGYMTQLVRQVAEAQASGKWPRMSANPPYNTEYSEGDEFYVERHNKVVKQRTVLAGFPRSDFPAYKLKMGSQRIMSAASLLRTVLLGRVR